MGIAALLCGIFYGALLHSAYRKAERLRYLGQFMDRGMARLLADIEEADCVSEYEAFRHGVPISTTWPIQHATPYYEGSLPSEHGACDCKAKRPFPGEIGPSVSVGD